MVKAVIDIGEREDRVLTIVKGKYGLKNKNDAVNLIIQKFDQELLEPGLRPEPISKSKDKKNNSGGKGKNA